ncbi:CHAT domain-containing protein [Ascidiimonas sp. W6]|uniref:CHAT domain-containing protein n=1 Tax=Ascidiimonas meishanensis TaxID=3128903 RepID=UPI0030EB4178
MTKTSEFLTFYHLYSTGDYRSFIKEFELIRENASENLSFLAIKVYNNSGNWKEVERTLLLLKKSSDTNTQIRARLSKTFYEFISSGLQRSLAIQMLKESDILLKADSHASSIFHIKTFQTKVKLALLTTGLIDADEKELILEEGISTYQNFKSHCTPEDSIDFLRTLINSRASSPIPDMKGALDLIHEILPELKKTLKPIQYVSIELKEIELRLKTTYVHGINFPEKLPDFIEDLIKDLKDHGYFPAEASLYAIYGNHLLGLELIEGIKWLETSIPLLWKLGHEQDAYTHQNNVAKWLENRAQTETLANFNANINLPFKKLKTPLEKEVETLYEAHQYFANGDYYISEKVLSERLQEIRTEANKIHFLTLIVNSRSKLQIDNRSLVKTIDSYIGTLNGVKKSILIAQLYNFKALLENNLTGKNQAITINIFKDLKSREDEIKQRINRFTNTVLLKLKQKKSLLDENTIQDLKKSDLILNTEFWIPNRNTLRGKVFQAYGEALYKMNLLQDANKSLAIASTHFIEANNLYEFVMNEHRVGLLLLTQARSSQNLDLYEKARNVFSKAIPILSSSNLIEFIKSFQFMITLSYAEPIVHKLISKHLKEQFIKKASELYMDTLETYETILAKNSLGESSEVLESIISLKKDMNQLIDSGFQFFRVTEQLQKGIYWLERTRVKALVSLIANHIKPPNNLIEHSLIQKELRLLKILQKSITIKIQKQVKNELDDVYKQMLKDSDTTSYAKRKLLQVPDFNLIKKELKYNNSRLKERKLFFLYFHIHGNTIYTLGIHADLIEPLVEKINISGFKLQEDLETFRMKLASYSYIPFNDELWIKYSKLIEPLQKWTEPEDIICIIPHSFLQNLPLHVLHINGVPLIKRNPVCYNNSLTSWEYLQSKNSRKKILETAYVFGDPEENLPKSRKEAAEIANILKAYEFTGKKATKAKFKKSLKQASIIHFAGHGLFESNNGFQSGIRFYKGELLTAHEIINHQIEASLIVLASCDTALQKNHKGDELSGLTTAFLSAGSSSILSGLWPVDDSDSQEFFAIFYIELAKETPKVIALQKAMISLMQRPGKSHFYHWGMFALTGNWE